MDINHLFYFKRVAELQNYTRAAEELIITQPALSRVIHNLEAELGYKLFERRGKNVVLNGNGVIFLKYTNQIFDSLDRAKTEMKELENNNAASINVVMRTAVSVLPFLIKSFKEEQPEITINIFRNIKDEMSMADADFYIDVMNKREERDNNIILLEEGSRLLVSKQILAEYPENPQLHDFRTETFFALGNGIQKENTEIACRNAGFTPRISTDFASSETIHSFLETGLGVAIVPEKTWNYATHPGLVMADIPIITNQRYLCMRVKESQNPNIIAFREFCIDFFEKLQEIGNINKYIKLTSTERD